MQRNTNVALSQRWFYSESYRCEQVPSLTGLFSYIVNRTYVNRCYVVSFPDANMCQGMLMCHSYSPCLLKWILQMLKDAKDYWCGNLTGLCYRVSQLDVDRCQGILIWHPHRTVLYNSSTRCGQVPRITDVAPSQGWFYSESYRCEQVPRNTDVAPSQIFLYIVNHTDMNRCYIVSNSDANMC